MNKELLKLKKIISNLEQDKEHIQGKKLNEIMNLGEYLNFNLEIISLYKESKLVLSNDNLVP